MISNPRKGQSVQLWYALRRRPVAPLHGLLGTVEVVGRGRPRNHGIVVSGVLYVVPCGQLRRVEW